MNVDSMPFLCSKCGKPISNEPGTKGKINPFTNEVSHAECPAMTPTPATLREKIENKILDMCYRFGGLPRIHAAALAGEILSLLPPQDAIWNEAVEACRSVAEKRAWEHENRAEELYAKPNEALSHHDAAVHKMQGATAACINNDILSLKRDPQ